MVVASRLNLQGRLNFVSTFGDLVVDSVKRTWFLPGTPGTQVWTVIDLLIPANLCKTLYTPPHEYLITKELFNYT